jgi:hypothetical protein
VFVTHVRDCNSDISVIENRNASPLIYIRTTYHLKTIPPDALCNTKVNVKFSSTEIKSPYC